MLELILVRHGETESYKKGTYCGWTDVGLNDTGIKQANAAAEKLAGIKADAIYTSPLKRAALTAEIINRQMNSELRISDDLIERNFGAWEDLTHDEIAANNPGEYELWTKDWVNYCIKGGESALQAYKRAAGFVDQLCSSKNCGTCILVTHSGCIRSILAHLLGLPAEGMWHFKLSNGSISKVEITGNYPVITLLNG